MKKKLIYLLLAVIMLLPMISYAGPQACHHADSMPPIEKYGQPIVVDLATVGVGWPYTGYYYGELKLSNGVTRIYKEYIPEGTIFNDYHVIITIPDGYNTEDFLVKSGWKALADEHKLVLFIMEPLNQKWGLVDGETLYIAAAYAKKLTTKGFVYIVGYDNGGQALQQVMMTNAISIASAAFINASKISSSYLTSMGTQFYKANTSDNSIYYNDVPVPIWIIDANMDSDTLGVIDYWKHVNETMPRGVGFNGGKIYYQDKTRAALNHFTPSGPVASVAALQRKVHAADPNFSRMLYEKFLSRTTRFGGTAWSSVVMPRLDFKKLHVKNYSFVDQGIRREYCVYVPKHLKHSRKPLPVVYTWPGGDGNQFWNLEVTRLTDFADKYGWIIVSTAGEPSLNKMPTNTGLKGAPIAKWLSFNDTGVATTPGYVDVIEFMKALMEQVETKYNVDTTRRYLNGFSNGAAGLHEVVRAIPEYFATFTRYSGDLVGYSSTPLDMGTCDLPIYAVVGENNGPAVNLDGTFRTNCSQAFPLYLTKNLGYSAADANYLIAHPAVNGQVKDLNTGIIQKTWEWQDAYGTPIFRTTTTSKRGHSVMPPDTEVMAEWNTHWSRVGGKVVYED
jgi:poly(3-hydroxybutyrate) depolymerase